MVIAWNNLGVAFQRASLNAMAIGAYRKSAAEGETLAMSNLAHRMMSVGLLEEADSELQKALKIENFHRNVGEAVAQLRDIPENERISLKAAQEKSKGKIEFFQRLGRAISRTLPPEIGRAWSGPNGRLDLQIEGSDFKAVGEYEVESRGLAFSITGAPTKRRYSITYLGKVVGCRVFGTVNRKEQSPQLGAGALSLLGDDSGSPFAMEVHEGAAKISVMESPSSSVPRVYELARNPSSDVA